MIDSFFGTFWTSSEVVSTNGEDLKTVHEIIALVVLEDVAQTHSISVPHIYQSQLPKAPKS